MAHAHTERMFAPAEVLGYTEGVHTFAPKEISDAVQA